MASAIIGTRPKGFSSAPLRAAAGAGAVAGEGMVPRKRMSMPWKLPLTCAEKSLKSNGTPKRNVRSGSAGSTASVT